jgi:RNA polymerase sigma-70 factor (ECF subfamily)
MFSEDSQKRQIELLKRIADGDRQSFSELYDEFADILFATAINVTRRHETAEEVVQDVFVQIWQKAKLYNSARGKPLTWAIVLTRNRSIDRVRALQRQISLTERMENETLSAEETDSLHCSAVSDSFALAEKALQKLPPNQKKVIELVILQGFTMSEAATHLGEPVSAIKARVRRGLTKLRSRLPERF